MTNAKNTKKSAKTDNTKTDKTKNAKTTKPTTNKKPQTAKTAKPKKPAVSSAANDYTDNKTTLNKSADIPTEIKKEKSTDTESKIVYHVVAVQYADGTTIHKQFRVDKLPTHAVLVKYSNPEKLGAPKPHHVLTYSRSEKICNAHIRRIKKQYVAPNPTIEDRYTNEIELVKCRDLGMPTSEIDPNMTEDRTWERAKNAAEKIALHAKNASAVTATALALNTAVLDKFLNQ